MLMLAQDSFSAQQISISTNPTKGTLRGLHYLEERAKEWKAVVCVQGLVQDVVVDMREGSPTYKSHQSFYLDGRSNDGLLIPPGCAHGFLSLMPNTILMYVMTAPFDSDMERALRWDDPALNISWDLSPNVISDKDKSHGLL
jgi:dTDP-4-dehydrorhamnose 3,5-epimerase